MKISLSLALLGAAALTAAPHAFAQTDAPTKPATAEVKQSQNRTIALKNLDAQTMAYWLDPVHNPAPRTPEFFADPSLKLPLAQSLIVLPPTIERVMGTSSRSNRLIVLGGSDEDVQKLRGMVESLDKLLPRKESEVQVEIEALAVDISAADLKTLLPDGLANMKNLVLRPNSVSSNEARSNFRARLDALIANGAAEIISAPIVNAFDNTSVPLNLTLKSSAENEAKANPNLLATSVTPAVNRDGTISMMIKARSTPLSNGSFLSISHKFSDGATLLLTGLTSVNNSTRRDKPMASIAPIPNVGPLFETPVPEGERHIAVFLTPRVVGAKGK